MCAFGCSRPHGRPLITSLRCYVTISQTAKPRRLYVHTSTFWLALSCALMSAAVGLLWFIWEAIISSLILLSIKTCQIFIRLALFPVYGCRLIMHATENSFWYFVCDSSCDDSVSRGPHFYVWECVNLHTVGSHQGTNLCSQKDKIEK